MDEARDPRPLRVCSFESRRQGEMHSMLARHGAVPTVAPSMREVPRDQNTEAVRFGDEVLAGRVDAVIFLTGVGTRSLLEILAQRHERAEIVSALERPAVIVRGPKPTAVLREWGVPIDLRAPEPNTWREILQAIDESSLPLEGRTVAVQEYGEPSRELCEALTGRGATVVPVPVYRWALPEDTRPLEEAVRTSIDGGFDVLLFTSARQVAHVLEVADRLGLREEWLRAARSTFVGSIGPTCSQALREAGLPVTLEPSHPRMGHLVRESLAAAR